MGTSRLATYVVLGRVSNLPTVWTNALAGVVLSGAPLEPSRVAALSGALSLFYVGGMFLNDAFDREIDARERPERPIPSGRVTAGEVFGIGFGLLGAGIVLVAAFGAASSAALLAALIVIYDAWHKQNPGAPVVMGACRAVTYMTAGLAAGGALHAGLLLPALALGVYVVGLTFVARQENRRSYRAGFTLLLIGAPLFAILAAAPADPWVWLMLALFTAWAGVALAPLFSSAAPNVGRSVVRLIAGISLADGAFLAASGSPKLGALGVAGLALTLALQRWVKGT